MGTTRKDLALEMYRQAGAYLKAGLYSAFLLNGGSITALLAHADKTLIKVAFPWLLSGLICAVLSLFGAYFITFYFGRFHAKNADEAGVPPVIIIPIGLFVSFFVASMVCFCIGTHRASVVI